MNIRPGPVEKTGLLFVVFLLSTVVAVGEQPLEDDPLGHALKPAETGFFGILSPEVGGGRMVPHGAPNEVIYLSEDPVLKGIDIESVNVSFKLGYHIVRVTLKTGATERLLEIAKRPFPSIYSLVFIEDGKIRWTRGLVDLLTDDSIKIAVFETKSDAEGLAELLRQMKSGGRAPDPGDMHKASRRFLGAGCVRFVSCAGVLPPTGCFATMR